MGGGMKSQQFCGRPSLKDDYSSFFSALLGDIRNMSWSGLTRYVDIFAYGERELNLNLIEAERAKRARLEV